MKADLHFHPCFFNKGAGFQFTQWRTPHLKRIIEKALEKKIELLTITSCSTYNHFDPRWYETLHELEDVEKYEFEQIPQGIKIKGKNLYIFHGQELKTDKADLNVLFAQQRVPIDKTKGKLENVLDAAKDSGDNVLIGINELSRSELTEKEIRDLYEKGKIHFIEIYNSMDSRENNDYAHRISLTTKIPGIAVSDSHTLNDMAKAYTDFSIQGTPSLRELPLKIKEALENQDYTVFRGNCSWVSKELYLARLSEAIIKFKLGILK